MSSPIINIQNAYDQYLTHDNGTRTYLQDCLTETQEFKTQLRKLKAHLNKHIQETKSLESNDTENKIRLEKRRSLILDKLNKSYKQWDNSIVKHTKRSKQGLTKFNSVALSSFQRFNIDNIYNNRISNAYKKDIQGAVQSHICRYSLSDVPVQDTEKLLRYLQNVYDMSPELSSEFIMLGQILYGLSHRDFQSCWNWSYIEQQNNQSHMMRTLRYKLYIFKALIMTQTESVEDVCYYLVNQIPQGTFQNEKVDFAKDASAMLGQLMIQGKINNFDSYCDKIASECRDSFTQEYCSLYNLPNESPLSLVIMSGILSSQFFMKYAQIKSSAHIGWTTANELPFDVDLPDSLTHFHPVFICPVLKEETTTENPPYSLACHHIISKKALDKLSKNGTISFKCPYCPVQSTISKTQLIRFVML
ncbi:hypothetical protein C6P45_000119 [Maudiozyma exigua]|uniref:GID complex catalytic subunit 2 n=1 Tax=Maudiozyma exigua TaxID=34358 RepID=A0A9P6WDW3_MAUEX|nr:hypothetical protein C6P45_000119 [Kazachstania exigua]